jgi:hypothetical protein
LRRFGFGFGSLGWREPFIKQFRYLDLSGDGRLGKDDMKIMLGKSNLELAALRKALSRTRQRTPIRVGEISLNMKKTGDGVSGDDLEAALERAKSPTPHPSPSPSPGPDGGDVELAQGNP